MIDPIEGGTDAPGSSETMGRTVTAIVPTSRTGLSISPVTSNQGPDSTVGTPPRGLSARVETCNAKEDTQTSLAMIVARARRGFMRGILCTPYRLFAVGWGCERREL